MKYLCTRLRPASVALLLLMLHANPVAAQLGVAKRVVASGGTAMGSANFGVSGTAGQVGTGQLKGENFAAQAGFWFTEGSMVTAIGDLPEVSRVFALEQNYPNPFNPATTIEFILPRQALVKLRVFDATGRLVDEIVNEVRPAGTYREAFTAPSLASGIYFYRMETNGFVQTRKLLLLK